MDITINIPSLDRLATALETYVATISGGSTSSATPAPEKPKAGEKPAKPKAESKPKAPVITEDDVVTVAKKLVAASGPAALRSALDSAGLKGRKISEASKDEYPAILEAVNTALADAEESGL